LCYNIFVADVVAGLQGSGTLAAQPIGDYDFEG